MLSFFTMRVAFITHEPFYPPSGGGSAEAVYLVEEMVRRGNQVHVFSPPVPDRAGTEELFGIQLHEFRSWKMGRYTSFRVPKYLLYPMAIGRLVGKAARQTPYDLVFGQHAIGCAAAGKVAARLGVPVVMNFLDYLTGFMETWPRYMAPPLFLRLLKQYELSLPARFQADAVLTVSDPLAEWLVQKGCSPERVLPVYYGFDRGLFPFRKKVTSGESAPVVVMHGSLDHHHLNRIALRTVEEIARTVPTARFKFVGHRTSALERFFRQVAERAPNAELECAGFVPYAEVASHLEEAAVGIVPYEQSSGTHCAFVAKVVEYLALGLPVVSTPLQGVKSYFKNEPMVRFSAFDGVSFAEAIRGWLRHPPDMETARAASERVGRELDWRAISRKAIDFIEVKIPRETKKGTG
jgi:glycosyltransferase involved in cell wall biosynthesis